MAMPESVTEERQPTPGVRAAADASSARKWRRWSPAAQTRRTAPRQLAHPWAT